MKLENITNDDIVNLTNTGKSIVLYDSNKKLTVSCQRDLIFNQMNKLAIKFYSLLQYMNISNYRKF